MKKFETPELEVLEFDVADIIATSTTVELPETQENDLPWN